MGTMIAFEYNHTDAVYTTEVRFTINGASPACQTGSGACEGNHNPPLPFVPFSPPSPPSRPTSLHSSQTPPSLLALRRAPPHVPAPTTAVLPRAQTPLQHLSSLALTPPSPLPTHSTPSCFCGRAIQRRLRQHRALRRPRGRGDDCQGRGVPPRPGRDQLEFLGRLGEVCNAVLSADELDLSCQPNGPKTLSFPLQTKTKQPEESLIPIAN